MQTRRLVAAASTCLAPCSDFAHRGSHPLRSTRYQPSGNKCLHNALATGGLCRRSAWTTLSKYTSLQSKMTKVRALHGETGASDR